MLYRTPTKKLLEQKSVMRSHQGWSSFQKPLTPLWIIHHSSAVPIDPEKSEQVPRSLWARPTHFVRGSGYCNLERLTWANVLLPAKASPWKCTLWGFSLALLSAQGAPKGWLDHNIKLRVSTHIHSPSLSNAAVTESPTFPFLFPGFYPLLWKVIGNSPSSPHSWSCRVRDSGPVLSYHGGDITGW